MNPKKELLWGRWVQTSRFDLQENSTPSPGPEREHVVSGLEFGFWICVIACYRYC